MRQEPDLDGCPDALRPLITRCLAKDPAQRPAPAEIIAGCRAHTADQTLQIARSWLPAPVSEGLARYAPPPQYAPPAQPAVSAPATAGAVPANPASPVPPARPAPLAPPPHGWAPGGPAWPAPPPPARPGRGVRMPRGAIVAGLAVVAAGVGTALALALSSGNAGSGNDAGPTGGTSPSLAVSGASGNGAGAPGQSPSPGPAACLAGTWKSVNQVDPETISGQQAVFSGSGGQAIFLPDGQYTLTYDNVVLSASVNGVNWTQTLDGVVTAQWTAENGSLEFTCVVQNVSDVYYEGGTCNSSARPTLATAVPFLCSGNTLSESTTTGSSDQYTRVAGNS